MSLPLDKARILAAQIRDALAPMCERIDIAGSIRRARPLCGDIDIVCLPRAGQRDAIITRCLRNGMLGKEGAQYVMVDFPGWDVQLDLWFAHNGTADLFAPEPPNHGIILLARTGSAMHNVRLAARAKSMGLHFHPSKGIQRGAEIIASAEEADIFRALGLPYIEPEQREVQP